MKLEVVGIKKKNLRRDKLFLLLIRAQTPTLKLVKKSISPPFPHDERSHSQNFYPNTTYHHATVL